MIGALCPWCLLVTATTTFVWFAITRFNIRENNLYLPKTVQKTLHQWIEKSYDKMVLFAVVTTLFAAIIIKYGPYLY